MDVLDYKLQERQKELTALEKQVYIRAEKAAVLEKEIEHMTEGIDEISEITKDLETDPEYQLPEPKTMMSAKNYKTQFVDPLIKKFKTLIKKILHQHIEFKKKYDRWRIEYVSLKNQVSDLRAERDELIKDNNHLYDGIRDLATLYDHYGMTINEMLEKARHPKHRDRERYNGDQKIN